MSLFQKAIEQNNFLSNEKEVENSSGISALIDPQFVQTIFHGA